MSETTLTKKNVRSIWMRQQGLHKNAPFGSGPKCVPKVIKQLGYVQIDTINVIERCHHHILYTRLPDYKKLSLHLAQKKNKTVFEYWTHALAYVPTEDFRYFINDMRRRQENPWYSDVTTSDLKKIVASIKKEGPITIRDVTDDNLKDKSHPWDNRKPSKKILQCAFNAGALTISERLGMLKKYDLTERHFDWVKKPEAATESEVYNYHLDRALNSQGVVSLDSICYLQKVPFKKEILKVIEARVLKGTMIPVKVEDNGKIKFWTKTKFLDAKINDNAPLTHILSPFDPLVIQRKRFNMFFDHDHRFEAYLPKEKRKYGYFALPILIGDKVVSLIDLKTDRQNKKLLVQQWSWLNNSKSHENKKLIEQELHRFENFQLDL